MHATAHMWRSEIALQESFLSFHRVSFGDPTQFIKLGGKNNSK